MSSKKKVFAVVITTAALTVGSFGAATAATKATRVSKSTKTSITTIADSAAQGKLGRGAELSALLSALVAKGTITQAQADAIIAAHAAADAARPAMGAKGPKGDKASMDQRLKVISTTLGIDTTTVLTRLKAGETLATIAGAKKDALIAALVADETKRIDADVTAGKLTAAQATAMKANLLAHVTAEVNSTHPVGPKMDGRGEKGGKGGRGHGGHGGGKGGPSGAPTIPAPAATTASNA